MSFEISSSQILKSKKEQIKLILIIYFNVQILVYPNGISKILPFQHVANIFKRPLRYSTLFQSLKTGMLFYTYGTSQFKQATF